MLVAQHTLDAVRLLQSNNRSHTAQIVRNVTEYDSGGVVSIPIEGISYKVRVYRNPNGQQVTNAAGRIEATDIWILGFPIEAVIKATDAIILDGTVNLDILEVADLSDNRSYLQVTCIRRGSAQE